MLQAQSRLPDRTAFHLRDEVQEVAADTARTSRDARSRLTGPGVPGETDGEAVIASGGRMCRKRTPSPEFIRTNSPKANVIVRKNRLHGDFRFDAFEVNPLRWHHCPLSLFGYARAQPRGGLVPIV